MKCRPPQAPGRVREFEDEAEGEGPGETPPDGGNDAPGDDEHPPDGEEKADDEEEIPEETQPDEPFLHPRCL